jgi:hypothetical protein
MASAERVTKSAAMSAAIAVLLLLRCGSDDEGSPGMAGGGFAGSLGPGDPGSGGVGGGAGAGGGISGDAAPPERELESSYRTPIATGRYVWTANPDSGKVALIDAFALTVKLTDAGFGPTYLAPVSQPGQSEANAAIVLNVLSRDATLLRVQSDQSLGRVTVPTHAGANAWAISPSGKWAVAWSSAAFVERPDPTDGFQEITVISLIAGAETSVRLSVGYRPSALYFDAAEARLFAVCEPGISVVALDGGAPRMVNLIEVSDDPLDAPASRDVTITRDGSLALVRREGSADVRFVPLDGSPASARSLSGPITDLDLSADGTRAVAVVRDRSEVFVLDIPAAATDAAAVEKASVPGELFGSVSLSPDGSAALLYTNAVPSDRVTILHLGAGDDRLSYRTVAVKSPVRAVFPAPDARHAIVLQDTAAGSTKPGAFSVVSVSAEIAPKIVSTDAPAEAVAFSPAPGSDRAIVTIRDEPGRVFGAFLVRMPSLQVDPLKLASPPLSTGVVGAARQGFVAQKHPEGRITFVDLESGTARTLTGFELGAKVVD